MPLNPMQRSLSLGRLYRASIINRGNENQGESIVPYAYFKGGAVNVYGSGSPVQPTTLSEMTLNAAETGITGVQPFGTVPQWIAIVQNSGTTSEITTYGVEVQDIGAIS